MPTKKLIGTTIIVAGGGKVHYIEAHFMPATKPKLARKACCAVIMFVCDGKAERIHALGSENAAASAEEVG